MKTPPFHFKKLVISVRDTRDNLSLSLHFIGLMIGLCPFTHEREFFKNR